MKRLLVLLLVASCACRSASQPQGGIDEKESTPAPAPDAGVIDAGATDGGAVFVPLSQSEYRAVFVRELMRLTKTREATVSSEEAILVEDGVAPHSIEVLKKIGQSEAFVVATAGFGRVPHGPRKKAHVELLAYVDHYGQKIGQVLEALGEAMHARGETGRAFKEYDTVELPQPVHGLQFFDLRPSGEIDISAELRVTLLKVVPMSHDEFDQAQKNPAGEWDDPSSNTRAAARWRRLLER